MSDIKEVLVATYEPSFKRILPRILGRFPNINLRVVDTIEEFRRMLKEKLPDSVMTDWTEIHSTTGPKVTGKQVLEETREACVKIMVVMNGRFGDAEVSEEIARMGARELPKPWKSTQDLVDSLTAETWKIPEGY